MNNVKQFCIITIVALIGELLHYVLPLSFPASIYGLVIMYLLLQFKIVKVEKIKPVSDFFIEVMPIMFVPACVGLMDTYKEVSHLIVPIILVGIVSTAVIMAVTGVSCQAVIRRSNANGKKGDR